MTVTKQQQLERMAKEFYERHGFGGVPVKISHNGIGSIDVAFSEHHKITREEWQQERDKMQKQKDNTRDLADSAKEIEKIDLQINVYGTKQDNSWRERGEFPPVGVTIEKKCKSATTWTETKIVAAGNRLVIFGYPDGDERVGWRHEYEFRPLRTEREKAIDEMALLAMECEKYDITQNVAKSVCELLYDAGYRKEQTK